MSKPADEAIQQAQVDLISSQYGQGIFVIRACHSHSGVRPRIGRTPGGWAIDWFGVHLSFRKERL